jgi:hypothetical protein
LEQETIHLSAGALVNMDYPKEIQTFISATLTYTIEVTGTNSNKVDEKSPLWIRPDKIENALKSSEKDVWIVHVLDRFDLIRCIHLKKEICEILLNRNRSIKKIRGSSETYIEILANEDIVKPIDELLNYIKPKLGL